MDQIRSCRRTDFLRSLDRWRQYLVCASGPFPVGNPQGAIIAIAPEGDIFVCWLDRGTFQIFVTRSQDAGLTFANPVPGNGPVQNLIQIPGTMNGNIRANSFPSIAIDQDDGQIYITDSSQVGPDRADVFLTVSKDHGKTWSRFYMVWGDNRDTVGARHDPNVYFAVFDVDD